MRWGDETIPAELAKMDLVCNRFSRTAVTFEAVAQREHTFVRMYKASKIPP